MCASFVLTRTVRATEPAADGVPLAFVPLPAVPLALDVTLTVLSAVTFTAPAASSTGKPRPFGVSNVVTVELEATVKSPLVEVKLLLSTATLAIEPTPNIPMTGKVLVALTLAAAETETVAPLSVALRTSTSASAINTSMGAAMPLMKPVTPARCVYVAESRLTIPATWVASQPRSPLPSSSAAKVRLPDPVSMVTFETTILSDSMTRSTPLVDRFVPNEISSSPRPPRMVSEALGRAKLTVSKDGVLSLDSTVIQPVPLSCVITIVLSVKVPVMTRSVVLELSVIGSRPAYVIT